MIAQFRYSFAFLSNFHQEEVSVDGVAYPSGEHAFQAMKSMDESYRRAVAAASTPGKAKHLGRSVVLRPDWEAVKIGAMRSVLAAKFDAGTGLGTRLNMTGDQYLTEGNYWGDTFWGVDLHTGRGQNWLGHLLMARRAELRGK